MADAVTPQPLAAIISMRLLDLDALEVAPLILVADRVSDPGNLGALVRVAEASGAAGLVLTGSCADPFGPKALRASAGSALRLPIVEVPDLRLAQLAALVHPERTLPAVVEFVAIAGLVAGGS